MHVAEQRDPENVCILMVRYRWRANVGKLVVVSAWCLSYFLDDPEVQDGSR